MKKYIIGKKKKNKFYEKHVYKNTEKLALLKSAAMFLIAFTITATLVGGVYAGVKKFTENKKEFKQEELKTGEKLFYYYQDNHNMDSYEKNEPWWNWSGYSYHKIKTYQEYLEAKEDISGLIEMTEEEFENNFMIIIGTFTDTSYSKEGVYIKDIQENETTLTILLDIDENKESSNLSVKLPLDMDKEHIELLLDYKKPQMEGFKPIDDIIVNSNNYNAEQLSSDNCLVIGQNNWKIDELNKLDKFIETTKQGISSSIRIIKYYNEEINYIYDIEYKDGEYIVEEAYPNKLDEIIVKKYYIGDIIKVEIREDKAAKSREKSYILVNNKRKDILLERFNKKTKDEYLKEKKNLMENEEYRILFYKDKEELKGNIYDENKKDYYKEIYEEEYLKAVEEYIKLEYEGPYNHTITEITAGQSQTIIHIYEDI